MFSPTNQPKNHRVRGIARESQKPPTEKIKYARIVERYRAKNLCLEKESLKIALALSFAFHTEQKDYFIIEGIIPEIVNLESFILSINDIPNNLYERIVFGKDSKGLRMQRVFNDGLEFKLLRDVLSIFLYDHRPLDAGICVPNKNIIWKILKSEPGCIMQKMHMDAPEMIGVLEPEDVRYSIILSIMDGTKIVLHNSKVVALPLRGMIMFRGDYPHAGAAYVEANYRVFVACYSNKFKPLANDFIGLV